MSTRRGGGAQVEPSVGGTLAGAGGGGVVAEEAAVAGHRLEVRVGAPVVARRVAGELLTPYRAAFLGHRIGVNEGNQETALGYELMREKMGGSMAQSAAELDSAVPVLFQLPIKKAK